MTDKQQAWLEWCAENGLISQEDIPVLAKKIEAGERVEVTIASGSRGKVNVRGKGKWIPKGNSR
tara:strand:+ start:1621 stop:1812 length:192 start_codon:yes stop_codon:yes gene_type:complete